MLESLHAKLTTRMKVEIEKDHSCNNIDLNTEIFFWSNCQSQLRESQAKFHVQCILLTTENVYRENTPGFKLHIQAMTNVVISLQQKLLSIY